LKATSGQRLWQLASFLLFFALWELAGRWPVSPAFPPFTSTFMGLLEMVRDGSLLKAYWITAQPLLIGMALCAVVGIAFGIGMGLSRRAGSRSAAHRKAAVGVRCLLERAPRSEWA
jgi:NitT/TauT family transport system permease protein